MSQGELDVTLDAHERLIDGRPGGRRAVLTFANLSGLDISGRNLTEADLSGALMEATKAVKTNFERATLFGSDLRRADMRGANLRRADLRGASLRGANLSQADLTQADFRVGRIAVADKFRGLSSMRHEMPISAEPRWTARSWTAPALSAPIFPTARCAGPSFPAPI
jgi:hypothetical protein